MSFIYLSVISSDLALYNNVTVIDMQLSSIFFLLLTTKDKTKLFIYQLNTLCLNVSELQLKRLLKARLHKLITCPT